MYRPEDTVPMALWPDDMAPAAKRRIEAYLEASRAYDEAFERLGAVVKYLDGNRRIDVQWERGTTARERFDELMIVRRYRRLTRQEEHELTRMLHNWYRTADERGAFEI
jgi:hypothetical protein